MKALIIFLCVLMLSTVAGCKSNDNRQDNSQNTGSNSSANSSANASQANVSKFTVETFPYVFDIPSNWTKKIVTSSSVPVMVIAPATPQTNSKVTYFVSPGMEVSLQNSGTDINSFLNGNKSNTPDDTITKAGIYDCAVYKGVTSNARKDYTRYYAFINTDEYLAVVTIYGDDTLKDELYNNLKNALKSFKKAA